MCSPLLSIVIPCYNSERYLRDCLSSIVNRPEIEVLIIDGSVTTKSYKIALEFKFHNFVVIHERDYGQSDAINKGFVVSSGRFFTWLNSDDVFLPGSLEKLLLHLKYTNYDWIVCDQVYMESNGRIMSVHLGESYNKFWYKMGACSISAPSSIISRRFIEKYGWLDLDLKYTMDAEYWARLIFNGHVYNRLPLHLWGFRVHENSKTSGELLGVGVNDRHMQERKIIAERYKLRLLSKRWLLLYRIYRLLFGNLLQSQLLTIRYKGLYWYQFPGGCSYP